MIWHLLALLGWHRRRDHVPRAERIVLSLPSPPRIGARPRRRCPKCHHGSLVPWPAERLVRCADRSTCGFEIDEIAMAAFAYPPAMFTSLP